MEQELVSRDTNCQPPLVMTKGIVRARLLNLLDPDDQTRVILVTAPAGYGKTTLLAQHFSSSRASGRTVAWLSLDENMASAEVLADHIRYAIASAVRATSGETSSAFHTGISDKALLRAVQHAITRVDGPLTLYLDDVHNIETPGALALLDGLLGAMPDNLNLVLASRSRPALRLARLAATGELREISDLHLAFTSAEAVAFLGNLLPEQSADELVIRTEGWPAGLQLCRFMLATDASARDLPRGRAEFDVKNISGRAGHIVDYLAEQVFDRVDPEIQNFLLKTAVLKRISGPFADEITGADTGGKTLEWLYNNNLFIVALDSEKEWFRYHQLFREFLLDKLRKKDPRAEEEINRRAAVWLADNGYFRDAAAHAFATKDLSFVNTIAGKAGGWRRIISDGTLMFQPLDDVDEEELKAYPTLQLARVYSILHHGQLRRARHLFDAAFSDAGKRAAAVDKELPSSFYEIDCQVIDLLISLYEDRPWPFERIAEFEERLKAEPGLDPGVEGIANELLAWVYHWAGKFEKSVGTALMAAQKCRMTNAPFIEFYAHLARGMSLLALARLTEAEEAFDAAYDVGVGVMGPDDYQCAAATVCKAEVKLELGGVEEVEDSIASLVPIINSNEVWVDLAYSAYKINAWVKVEHHDLPGALAVIEEALALFAELPQRFHTMLKIQKGRILLAAGEVDEAALLTEQELSDEILDDIASSRPEAWRIAIPGLLLLSRLEIARGNPEKASGHLLALKEWLMMTGARRYQAEHDLAVAMLLQLCGNSGGAADAIAKALAGAVATGQVFPLVMWLNDLRPYLRDLVKNPGDLDPAAVALANSLIACDLPCAGEAGRMASVPVLDGLVRVSTDHPALSPREQEVFRLLCDGLTSKQIARELDISANTAMGYRKSIYKKLDVSSRAGLVRVARGQSASP